MGESVTSQAEQYQNAAYAVVQDQESRAEYGLTIDQLHQTEAHFALQSAGIQDWKEDDRILDLASGKGGHAQNLHAETGAFVEGMDLSAPLIELGKQELAARSDDFHQKISLAVGNMFDTAPLLEKGAKYRLITILGSSFIFSQSPEQVTEALRAYKELLAPGGKIVLQFRDRNPEDWAGHSPETPPDPSIETSEEHDGTSWIHDKSTGTAHYARLLPVHPPREIWPTRIQRNAEGEAVSWLDADDVGHNAFERVFVNEHGEETPMGRAEITSYNRLRNAHVLERKLADAGFKNVQRHVEGLSPRHVMFTITGEA